MKWKWQSSRQIASTWLGWLTGSLLIRVPWGPPSFSSWASWTTLWSLTVFALQHALLVDFSVQTKFLNALAVNELTQRLHDVIFLVTYGAFWTVRLTLLVNAKELASLLHVFYHQGGSLYSRRTEEGWKWAWGVVTTLTTLSAALVIASGGLFVAAVRSVPKKQHSLFQSFLGDAGSGVLSAFFGHLATMSYTNVAYGLVTYIAFNIGVTFCDYCEELEEHLEELSSRTGNKNEMRIMVKNQDFNEKGAYFIPPQLQPSPQQRRDMLLAKFEGVQRTISLGSRITSPLSLVVIVVETFKGVSNAHEMLINKLGGLFLYDNYVAVFQQLIHAGLVFVGQYVEDKMYEKRKRLEKMITLLKSSEEDRGTINLVQHVINYEWKLSACGFFIVDKKLLSGMCATAMTYIVILVQLQISLQSSNNACSSYQNFSNATNLNYSNILPT